jgi:hypothetical protein
MMLERLKLNGINVVQEKHWQSGIHLLHQLLED